MLSPSPLSPLLPSWQDSVSSSLKTQATNVSCSNWKTLGSAHGWLLFSGRLSAASQHWSARTFPHLKSCSKSRRVGHVPERVLLGSFPTPGHSALDGHLYSQVGQPRMWWPSWQRWLHRVTWANDGCEGEVILKRSEKHHGNSKPIWIVQVKIFTSSG